MARRMLCTETETPRPGKSMLLQSLRLLQQPHRRNDEYISIKRLWPLVKPENPSQISQRNYNEYAQDSFLGTFEETALATVILSDRLLRQSIFYQSHIF